MEGSFTFVEGTLENPAGGCFDVEVHIHTPPHVLHVADHHILFNPEA